MTRTVRAVRQSGRLEPTRLGDAATRLVDERGHGVQLPEERSVPGQLRLRGDHGAAPHDAAGHVVGHLG